MESVAAAQMDPIVSTKQGKTLRLCRSWRGHVPMEESPFAFDVPATERRERMLAQSGDLLTDEPRVVSSASRPMTPIASRCGHSISSTRSSS